MSDALIDTIKSLTSVLVEETQLLSDGRRGELEALAAAKLRLTARLEKQVAALARDKADWPAQLQGEAKAVFVPAVEAMQVAAAENGKRLLRQIELSRELMAAIADEAGKHGGTRSKVYGAAGDLHRSDLPTPISINARL